MKDNIKLFNKNCFEMLPNIADKSIDMILTDPPYGQTPLGWDIQVDLDALWKEITRICKQNAAICIFAQEPFASKLRLSNINNYKYDWYWKKERPTNIFQVTKRPAKYIENICVFYDKQCCYNEKKVQHLGPKSRNKPAGKSSTTVAQNNLDVTPYNDDGTRHPCEILEFNRDIYYGHYHPTQKPVELLKYLIDIYTNEGDTVLDMFMGSGSTGVACVAKKRSFIGVELDLDFYNTATKRITNQQKLESRRLF